MSNSFTLSNSNCEAADEGYKRMLQKYLMNYNKVVYFVLFLLKDKNNVSNNSLSDNELATKVEKAYNSKIKGLATTKETMTPFMYCSNPRIMKAFIEAGADLSIRENNGNNEY